MKRKHVFLLAIILTSFSLFFYCDKKEQQQSEKMTSAEETADLSTVQVLKPEPINYDSMLTVIAELVQIVQENPTEIEARRQLVAAAYDTTWDSILAAGFGRPVQKGAAPTIALRLAEQAAKADAFRWAAYIKKWIEDPTTPEFGKLTAEIQGGNFVAKKLLADSSVVVLLEVQKSKIP